MRISRTPVSRNRLRTAFPKEPVPADHPVRKLEGAILSAHRTPDVVKKYTESAEERGLKVIIAAAGVAAHLAGVVAARKFGAARLVDPRPFAVGSIAEPLAKYADSVSTSVPRASRRIG